MGKRELILDSIRKLIALGVSDDEIAANLADVGVEKKEAAELTKEARSGASSFAAPKIDEYVPIQPKAQQKQADSAKVSAENDSAIPLDEDSRDVFDAITSQLEAAQQNIERAEQASVPERVRGGSYAAGVSGKGGDVDIEPSEIDTGGGFADSEEKPDSEESLEEQAALLNEGVDLAKKVQAGPVSGSREQKKTGVAGSDDPLDALRRLTRPQKAAQSTVAGGQQSVSPLFSAGGKGGSKAEKQAPAESEDLIVNRIIKEVSSETAKKGAQPPQKTFAVQGTRKEVSGASVQKGPASIESVPDSDIEQLWKGGIIVAINAKLSEMKKLKTDVDSVVQQKIDSALKKEAEKFKVLLDSRKELIISSNKEALEEKLREIAFIIDSKITELKQYNVDLKANLATLERTKSGRDDALAQLSAAIEEVKRTKAGMISETNSELIKIKSQTQEFIDSADAHLKEMDDRIAKTLELEKNIAEGMLQEAEQRIDELAMQKAQGLLDEMEVELNKIRAAEKQLSLDTLKQKIEILDEFKKQFLKNMEESLAKMNDSIRLLDQKNSDAERQLNERVLIFDAKIEGLEKFEKEFSAYIQELLNKK